MSKIDEQLLKALGSGDEFDPFEPSEAEGMLWQAMDLFRGQQKFWNVMVVVFTFIFMGIMIYSAVQFFDAETTRMQIMWSVIFIWGALFISMLKMWAWMQMNKNSLAREIKRLELQIAVMKSVMEGKE